MNYIAEKRLLKSKKLNVMRMKRYLALSEPDQKILEIRRDSVNEHDWADDQIQRFQEKMDIKHRSLGHVDTQVQDLLDYNKKRLHLQWRPGPPAPPPFHTNPGAGEYFRIG